MDVIDKINWTFEKLKSEKYNKSKNSCLAVTGLEPNTIALAIAIAAFMVSYSYISYRRAVCLVVNIYL